jgi:predicted nucleic acid-binding protein
MPNRTKHSVIFLDANVIIYAYNPAYSFVLDELESSNQELACSEMVRLEVMGFVDLTRQERQKLEEFFTSIIVYPLDRGVVDMAIKIRQQKTIKSPDALIAATALSANQKLWTTNVKDFSWIENLEWYNPMQGRDV